MASLQVPQAPEVPPLHQSEQVKACQGLLVPIEIWCEEKSFIGIRRTGISQQDILLLGTAFDDVEDPIEASLVPHPLHIWSYILLVDLRRLCHHTNSLWRIFFDVLLGARVDQVEFEVGRSCICDARRGKIPAVYVIAAQILDIYDIVMDGFHFVEVAWERCPFGSEQSLEAINLAEKSHTATALVYVTFY